MGMANIVQRTAAEYPRKTDYGRYHSTLWGSLGILIAITFFIASIWSNDDAFGWVFHTLAGTGTHLSWWGNTLMLLASLGLPVTIQVSLFTHQSRHYKRMDTIFDNNQVIADIAYLIAFVTENILNICIILFSLITNVTGFHTWFNRPWALDWPNMAILMFGVGFSIFCDYCAIFMFNRVISMFEYTVNEFAIHRGESPRIIRSTVVTPVVSSSPRGSGSGAALGKGRGPAAASIPRPPATPPPSATVRMEDLQPNPIFTS